MDGTLQMLEKIPSQNLKNNYNKSVVRETREVYRMGKGSDNLVKPSRRL